MNNAIAKSLLIAGFVGLAGCETQPSPERSASQPTAAPGRHALEVRYQVDPARHRVWWLTREGVSLHDVKNPQRTPLTLPGWQWAGVPYGSPPDLALGAQGEALVTSDIVPTVWRIDPETLAVSVHPLALDADTDKDVGFSGIVYSPKHGVYFGVSSMHGSLWMIDRSLTRAQKIALSSPVRQAYRVAMAARMVRESGQLCVRAPHKDWTIDLVPDRRSAYVREAPCNDLPWQLSQLSLKGQ